MNKQIIQLKSEIDTLRQVTNAKLNEIEEEKASINQELDNLAKVAQAEIEEDEGYKNLIEARSDRVLRFLDGLSEVLSATNKHEPLTRVLRDLEAKENQIKVQVQIDERENLNEPPLLSVKQVQSELEKIKQIGAEREEKHSLDRS